MGKVGFPLPADVHAMIEIPVSSGELLDKITILEIKADRIKEPAKLANIRKELALLHERRATSAGPHEVASLASALKQLNERLWDIEDAIRDCERLHDFGPRFIDLARHVYKTNDERARLKRAIDQATGSPIREEKSYAAY